MAAFSAPLHSGSICPEYGATEQGGGTVPGQVVTDSHSPRGNRGGGGEHEGAM